MSYISDNFGLEEEGLQELEGALREMSLGKGDMIFSDNAMKYIKIYCLHDDVEKEKMLELENILLPNHIIKTEERGRK